MKKLQIFIFFIIIPLLLFPQQRSVCEITPLHVGKYPISMINKFQNSKMEFISSYPKDCFISVSKNDLVISLNGEILHNFLNTSIPRTGIEYVMYDDINDCDIPVFITYIKDEESKNKYFGIFVRYDKDLEYVFSYKAGTQIKSE